MFTVQDIQSARDIIRKAHAAQKRIGLVPTMGALHEGHLSLIRQARKQTDFVAVSIFVNPAQFSPSEDFNQYPRDLKADSQACEKESVDLVFAPSAEQMYPQPNLTWVNVEKLTNTLCGASRPGHFRGVTTVCTKLFNIIQPDAAFFGQKDAQQAIVIKRMVRDLNMPLEIVTCPIVREADGLAMSSRNAYLSDPERAVAPLLYQSLKKAKQQAQTGHTESNELKAIIRETLGQSPLIEPEYIEIKDSQTLEDVERIKKQALIAIAVRIGKTRLIDNIIIGLNNSDNVVK